ncbi:MAG: hypothetical protein ABFD50_12330, partial [Smithella sp.]
LKEVKPLTGEPDAGNPPVRFGGRGGESLSYPYSVFLDSPIKSGNDKQNQFSQNQFIYIFCCVPPGHDKFLELFFFILCLTEKFKQMVFKGEKK